MRRYDVYMDALIARSRLPYSAPAPAVTIPNDAVNRIVCPDFDTARLYDANVRAADAMLCVAFALQAYHAEHGDYPETLATLVVDGDLSRVPADPFDPNSSQLRYRRISEHRYVLYSVGPDGKDDGGKPIGADDESHGRAHEFSKSDIGDMVLRTGAH